jgi:hypothetical protein
LLSPLGIRFAKQIGLRNKEDKFFFSCSEVAGRFDPAYFPEDFDGSIKEVHGYDTAEAVVG